MNLVNQLQASAESEDVLTVLRKARRLASKLGVNDIDEWLKAEQNGYEREQAVPDYRQIKCKLVYRTNGYVPAGFGMGRNGICDFGNGGYTNDSPLSESISMVMTMIHNITEQKHGIYYPVPNNEFTAQLRRQFDPLFAPQITFLFELNASQIRVIPDAVKDRILDWSCELERRGVKGDDMTFNESERQLAHSITFNITGSTIEQLNNMGSNHRR